MVNLYPIRGYQMVNTASSLPVGGNFFPPLPLQLIARA
jgi:hypothetical protein|tara:strand:- start:271 stop:384 length:114 start_codon:yes stop_codon:yes gene_type:complete